MKDREKGKKFLSIAKEGLWTMDQFLFAKSEESFTKMHKGIIEYDKWEYFDKKGYFVKDKTRKITIGLVMPTKNDYINHFMDFMNENPWVLDSENFWRNEHFLRFKGEESKYVHVVPEINNESDPHQFIFGFNSYDQYKHKKLVEILVNTNELDWNQFPIKYTEKGLSKGPKGLSGGSINYKKIDSEIIQLEGYSFDFGIAEHKKISTYINQHKDFFKLENIVAENDEELK